MTNCWKGDPNLRPSFESLRNKLKEMEKQRKVDLWSLRIHLPTFDRFRLNLAYANLKELLFFLQGLIDLNYYDDRIYVNVDDLAV